MLCAECCCWWTGRYCCWLLVQAAGVIFNVLGIAHSTGLAILLWWLRAAARSCLVLLHQHCVCGNCRARRPARFLPAGLVFPTLVEDFPFSNISSCCWVGGAVRAAVVLGLCDKKEFKCLVIWSIQVVQLLQLCLSVSPSCVCCACHLALGGWAEPLNEKAPSAEHVRPSESVICCCWCQIAPGCSCSLNNNRHTTAPAAVVAVSVPCPCQQYLVPLHCCRCPQHCCRCSHTPSTVGLRCFCSSNQTHHTTLVSSSSPLCGPVQCSLAWHLPLLLSDPKHVFSCTWPMVLVLSSAIQLLLTYVCCALHQDGVCPLLPCGLCGAV